AVRDLTVNKTQNVTVNKTINITHIQNTTVLAPAAKASTVRATNLGALALARGADPREVKPVREFKFEPVGEEQRGQVDKALAHQRELAPERSKAEARLLKEAPNPGAAPAVKFDLPKAPPPPARPSAPPPRKTPPAPPTPPKHEERPIPKPEPKPR